MPDNAPFLARTGRGIVAVQPGELRSRDGSRIRLEGADSAARLEGREALHGVSHYALQRDPSQWIYDVPHYASVLAPGVYPGIDVRYHENRGNVEFDFEIAPGSDVSRVRFRFDGDVRISETGDLAAGGAMLHKPVAWQVREGVRKAVEVEFSALSDRVAGLRIGAHDPSLPLIVDPVIDFATFLGGSNNEFDTQVIADSSGAIYMAGSTQSTDFPATPEPGSPLNAAGLLFNPDVYVTRLKPDASAIDWSFFIGGSASNRCMGISQDSLGNIYLLGTTTSADFPVTPGAWKTNINSGFNDEFVLKLNAATGHIVAGTFLGIAPRNGGAVSGPFAVDSSGSVYVGAYFVDSTFQATPGAYKTTGQPSNATVNPALLHLNASLTSVLYATYIDLGTVVCLQVDSGGNAVFAGSSLSYGSAAFPAVNPISGVTQNGSGLYVAKINANGTAPIHASLLDGNVVGGDAIGDLMLDGAGNIYLAGETTDPQFPQVNPLTVDPLPAGYPKPGNVWPSPFIAELPPQGGKYTQSTFLYGPEFTTPGGAPTASWIKFAAIGGRVCVAGLGIVGSLVETTGGLVVGPPGPLGTGPLPGSTLVCVDPTSTYIDTKTNLPITGSGYSAVAATPDGALLFAGTTKGAFAATVGVVQPAFGGHSTEIPSYYLQYAYGDAFLLRVSLPNPTPQISLVYPDSLLLSNQVSGTATLVLAGIGFGYGTQFTVNGHPATATIYSTTQASIPIDFASLNRGANQVVASLGGPGGGTSAPVAITGINQAPGSIVVSPAVVIAGAAATTVAITGSNVSASSVLTWGGAPRTATFVGNSSGSGYFQVLLEPAELAQAATIPVTVTNPGPGGGVGGAVFTIQAQTGERVPSFLTSVPVANESFEVVSTSTGSALTIAGGGFDNTTQVYWDGAAIPATVNASTSLTMTPPSGSLSRPGAHNVFARNGALVSNTARIYVQQPLTIKVGAQAYDPVLQRLYLVSPASSAGASASLMAYDAVSGAQTASVPNIQSTVGPIAVSDDGQFVYIAGGANGLQVTRFNVAAGAVDLTWQVQPPPLSVTAGIEALFVASHSPQTLVVCLTYSSAFSLSRVANATEGTQIVVYDGSTPRFLTAVDSGVQLNQVSPQVSISPYPVFATRNRVIFENQYADEYPDGITTCWEWLDFDAPGIEGGNSTCGSEPAELVHDHGVSYLTDNNRTLPIAFLNAMSENPYSPLELLVDPVHRTAWALTGGQLTTFSLDSLQQSVTMVPNSTGTLYLSPGGPLLVAASGFLPVP